AAALAVDVEADVRAGEERERLLEVQRRSPELAQRVRDGEAAVSELDHVELDEVDPAANRRLERPQRVLGLERRGAAVPDPKDAPFRAPAKGVQAVRLTTTTAQSSVSSPPVNARQS